MNSIGVTSSEDCENQARIAQRYANLIGVMPASFSVAVKDLMNDEREGLESLSEKSEFQVGRVLRGATALSVLYWATRTFNEEKMPPGWIYSSLQIARFYRPSTLAAILAFTYLYKRIKRIVDPEEWQFISEPLQKNLEICGLLAWQIPEIGPTVGIIGGAMNNIAFACLSAHDKKGFIEYRRTLKIKKQFSIPSFELDRWGCTCTQIATQILLQSGFGIELAHMFTEGFREPLPLPNGERAKGPFVAVHNWLIELSGAVATNSVSSNGSDMNSVKNYNTPELVEKLKLINKQGSIYNWLEKGAADINPELTPNLLLDSVIFK